MEKVRLGDKMGSFGSTVVVVMSNWPIRAEIDPHVSSSKDTASMSREIVLSCRDLGHFGSMSGGGTDETVEDEETKGAPVNAAPFDKDSGLDKNLCSSVLGPKCVLFWGLSFA